MSTINDLRYIEIKSGYSDNGPAWIGYVKTSRSGQTVYFDGRALQKTARGMYQDIETGKIYWVSGIKKNGEDRHWAGNGKILVEDRAVKDYLTFTGQDSLPNSRYSVTNEVVDTDTSRFTNLLNQNLDDQTDEEHV